MALLVAVGVGATAHAQAYLATDESRNIQQVNGTRTSKGVKPLAFHAGLQAMARAQAVRMMQRGSIYHNPNLSKDITALGVNWKMVGENVGMGPDEDAIEGALLKSPHHYENIVRPNFNNIGVGIVKGADGQVYLVQVFAEIVPAAAPKVVAAPAPVRHSAPVVRPAAAAPVRVAPRPAPAASKVPVIVRRPDPNALMGGRVVTAELPAPRRPHLQTAGLFGRLLDSLTVWS